MRLILLGAPGAGKGTQAEILSKILNIPTISTGNILRAAIREGTPVGQKARSYMDQGQLVPDDVIIDIIVDRLAKPDCRDGYILDGVPRTIPQAQVMEEKGLAVDVALSIEVEDDVIVRRMSGRRVCPQCGQSYHIENNPPQVDDKCNACGSELIVRADDAPETVRARLETYHIQTEPLKSFYDERGKLVCVENRPGINATTEAIREALGI